jgi:hypothetical protein
MVSARPGTCTRERSVGGVGAEEHGDADHALPADGGGLHDLIGAQVGEDGDDADERKVHGLDRFSGRVQHLPGGQWRLVQVR